jgi:flagellar basal-body rod protein FlgG
MQPRMTNLEVIGNNLANIDTIGFKKDNLFTRILKEKGVEMAKGKGELAGMESREFTDFSDGSLKPTNNPLDLAMTGKGFFTIETQDGIRYTRNGNFALSTDGILVTSNGNPVMGTSGKIQLPDSRTLSQGDITVNEQGEITIDKKPVAKLRIATFDDLSTLKKDKACMFATDAPERAATVDGKSAAVHQGYLEESNVEGIQEMVQMLELSKSFETDQKAIQAQDATLDKAMEVGRV